MEPQPEEVTTLAGIRELEARIRALHEDAKRDALSLSDDLLETVYAGLALLPLPPGTTAERVIHGMVANATHAYRKAIDLATAGYYPLAWNVVRILSEFWISALYLVEKPGRAARWLDRKRNVPDFAHVLTELCDWMDDAHEGAASSRLDRLDKVQQLRYVLDEFAHATPTAWAYAPVHHAASHADFTLGPLWNPDQFDLIMSTALTIGDGLLDVLEASDSTNAAWRARVAEVEQRVADLQTRTRPDPP